MKNIIIYSVIIFSLFINKVIAQETFESKAKIIAEKIEKTTNEEKQALKIEVEEVNSQLENGLITKEQADEKKKKLAEARATIIENKVAVYQQELNDLVQQKVDGKIVQNKEYGVDVKWTNKNDTVQKSESRTTSQFVFALGLNNVITNGSADKSDFRYLGSHFYEWGITYNTRILKNDNLLHIKYGWSVMYNNLRPSDNRIFVKQDNQTNLEVSAIDLKDSRFKNVYLVAPIHLEFDFSKNRMKEDKPFFKSHQSLRLGLGGYAGLRLKSKQFQVYEVDGDKYTLKDKGDFNVNNFIYGLSAYMGYKETSLYLKYDLNPMFQDNAIKQNNVSLGVRFDFN